MTEELNGREYLEFLKEGHDDVLLHQSIKDVIQDMIDTLQSEYNKVILDPSCTEYDALEYIMLFAVEGNIAATLLGSNMEEYYAAVDIYCALLGLYGDDINEKVLSQERNKHKE